MTQPETPRLFDPDDPRMIGKRYLTDGDPQLQRSRAAYEAWRRADDRRPGDVMPDDAILWYVTRTRMAKVAVDLQTGELFVHEYPDWRSVSEHECASMYSHAGPDDWLDGEGN